MLITQVPHNQHGDVMKWKHFPRNCPSVRRIHRSPVNSPHKGQWRRALMFSLICVWINGWVNNREAGDLRRHRAHYDFIVMNEAILKEMDIILWRRLEKIPWWTVSRVNTFRPTPNGRHFTDATFKRIFMNWNVRVLIEISMKFVPKSPINNSPALVQIMAWRRPGDKPFF